MGKLVIYHERISPGKAEELVSLCPFGAISYEDGKLDISSGCKMCKMCVRKSGGAVGFVEEAKWIDKSLWKGICVYADCSGGKLHRVTFELCGKARELARVTGHPVYALVIGHDIGPLAETLRHYGVDKVFVYDHAGFADFRIGPYTAAFCHMIEKVRPSSILVGATDLGRQLAPRVAARCRTGLTADCTMLEMKEDTDLVQIRPAFGGNIMAQIVTPHTRPQFCTVRYKVFPEPSPTSAPSGQVVAMEVTDAMLRTDVKVLRSVERPRDMDIAEAEVIVAVGRGASSEAMREQARILAQALGGVVACTRPLVESNIFDAKHQIGLSGRTVKPKLIITLGISGAVQFAAGMKGAECIVAIDKDPAAPIFDVAHYCVVGDVEQIVPELIGKTKGVS